MHISSSHAKMFGETNFRTREIPRSGSKAKNGEKEKERERERERLNDGNNNGQAMHAARKPPGPIEFCEYQTKCEIIAVKFIPCTSMAVL